MKLFKKVNRFFDQFAYQENIDKQNNSILERMDMMNNIEESSINEPIKEELNNNTTNTDTTVENISPKSTEDSSRDLEEQVAKINNNRPTTIVEGYEKWSDAELNKLIDSRNIISQRIATDTEQLKQFNKAIEAVNTMRDSLTKPTVKRVYRGKKIKPIIPVITEEPSKSLNNKKTK